METPPLPRRSYPEIARDLEELGEYLLRLGLDYVPERLRTLVANIREVEKVRSQSFHEQSALLQRKEELVWSLVEGQQLSDIFRDLRDSDPTIFKRVMTKALQGPIRPIQETDSTNDARNRIFELHLAAQFRRAGLSAKIGEEPDLVVDYPGIRLYIECKRPLFEHSIPKNVKKAERQLHDAIAADRQSGSVAGLVAISISKAINSGKQWFQVNHRDAFPSLAAHAEQIHKRHQGDFGKKFDPRIVGIMYQLFTPAEDRASGHIVSATQTVVHTYENCIQASFPQTGTAIRNLLQRLKSIETN